MTTATENPVTYQLLDDAVFDAGLADTVRVIEYDPEDDAKCLGMIYPTTEQVGEIMTRLVKLAPDAPMPDVRAAGEGVVAYWPDVCWREQQGQEVTF